MKYKIIDLFSGAGGLTEGFRTDNFDIIGHIEKNEAASQTLKLRDAYYYLLANEKLEIYYNFLSKKIDTKKFFSHIPDKILKKTINEEINNETITSLFDRIDVSLHNGSITGIIGGPPCQAYSTIGRVKNAAKKASDERIYLYRYYIEFLKHYRPKFFVFENVKGLLSFKDINDQFLFPKMKAEFENAGYVLDYQVVNTQDYAIPQSRERIIIFGIIKENSALISEFFVQLNKLKEPIVPLRKILNDLPFMHNGEEVNHYSCPPNSYIRKYYRSDLNSPLTQNISRPHIKRDLKIYEKVIQAKDKGYDLKYNELDSKLRTHKNTDNFLDRYKALSWNKPAHTIVAHISKDGHHYIHPDIKQDRSITVREAARIQGFPDNYYFESSRTQAFTQIGNAVPPILSQKIAKVIEHLLVNKNEPLI